MANAKKSKSFWVETGGVCPDCLMRGAVTELGAPRTDRWYGYSLTFGCQGCGGTGRTGVEIKNLEELMERVLTPKQRLVIELRFGLKDGVVYTQREVAEALGVTQQSAADLEKRAKKRLRAKASRAMRLLYGE